MEAQQSGWIIVLLVVLWLGLAAQFALALRASRVEKREGMAVSRGRIAVLGAMLLVGSILLILTLTVPAANASGGATAVAIPASVAGADRETAQTVQQDNAKASDELKQLQKQEQDLAARRKALQTRQQTDDARLKQLGVPTGRSALLSLQPVDARSRDEFFLVLLTLMMLAGVAILALGGRVQTLFPDGWPLTGSSPQDEAAQRAALDDLAALVEAEKYQEAWDAAARIREKSLRSFDQLDLMYLRAFSAVQLVAYPKPDVSEEQRRSLIEAAVTDLEHVAREAPKRAEAIYTLGMAYGLSGDYAAALKQFEAVETSLDAAVKVNCQANENICCLKLAEESLSKGDTNQAETYFSRVASQGEAGDVVQSRVRIAMIDLRKALNRKDLAAASAVLAKIEALPNLSKEHKAQVQVIGSALNARLALMRDDPQAALQQCDQFLAAHLPAGLPALTEETPEEMFSPIIPSDLAFGVTVYQGIYFIRAVALSKLESIRRGRLTDAQIDRLAEPLLRGLQLVPRQRDLLGALGGLYYWFRREKIAGGRRWLEAAVTMGARGRIIRAILERDRMIELERGSALDWFRSVSARFLRDPTLTAEVRHALVEELGRFQEFEPMLIELQEKVELEESAPTLEGLRGRAAYLVNLLANVAVSGPSDRFKRLSQIHAEYDACLKSLERDAQTISALEKRVFTELADSLVLR